MDWKHPIATFRYAHFERVEPERNAYRVYRLWWQPTLWGTGAVVRQFGRKGHSERRLYTEFPSLADAWPFIRALARARLRHHYQMVSIE